MGLPADKRYGFGDGGDEDHDFALGISIGGNGENGGSVYARSTFPDPGLAGAGGTAEPAELAAPPALRAQPGKAAAAGYSGSGAPTALPAAGAIQARRGRMAAQAIQEARGANSPEPDLKRP